MSVVFIDYTCEACVGEGCEVCGGHGIIGKCIPASELLPALKTLLHCLPFAEDMQIARRERRRITLRERRRITLRELSGLTGILPSRLSEIENARAEPTEGEQHSIRSALGLYEKMEDVCLPK